MNDQPEENPNLININIADLQRQTDHNRMRAQNNQIRVRALIEEASDEHLQTLMMLMFDCGMDKDVAWISYGYIQHELERRNPLTPETIIEKTDT